MCLIIHRPFFLPSSSFPFLAGFFGAIAVCFLGVSCYWLLLEIKRFCLRLLCSGLLLSCSHFVLSRFLCFLYVLQSSSSSSPSSVARCPSWASDWISDGEVIISAFAFYPVMEQCSSSSSSEPAVSPSDPFHGVLLHLPPAADPGKNSSSSSWNPHLRPSSFTPPPIALCSVPLLHHPCSHSSSSASSAPIWKVSRVFLPLSSSSSFFSFSRWFINVFSYNILSLFEIILKGFIQLDQIWKDAESFTGVSQKISLSQSSSAASSSVSSPMSSMHPFLTPSPIHLIPSYWIAERSQFMLEAMVSTSPSSSPLSFLFSPPHSSSDCFSHSIFIRESFWSSKENMTEIFPSSVRPFPLLHVPQ